MRRGPWLVWLFLVPAAFITFQVQGQDNKKDMGPGKKSFAEIHQNLQTLMDTTVFQKPLTLKEFIGLFYEQLHAQGRGFSIVVRGELFKEENPDEHPEERSVYENTQVDLPPWYKQSTAGQLLEAALAQIKTGNATYLVRAGRVEILTKTRASKEHLLNQTFFADFKNLPLEDALDELGERTGVSVVIDGRAKDMKKTAITARFRNDVAVQDAVRILAEMADLKLVHLPTGLFVTTAEQAQKFRKELKDIYEPGVPGAIPAELSPLVPSYSQDGTSPLAPPTGR